MRTLLLLMAFSGLVLGDEAMPSGTPVSRPLTPVELPPEPKAEATEPSPPPVIDTPCEPCRAVLPESWSSYELLLWWSKAQPLPVLVTGSQGPAAPVPGGRDTLVLVGGSSLGEGVNTGFRFTMGWTLLNCDERRLGFEFSGLFLGTSVSSVTSADFGNRFEAIARPYTDAATGAASLLPVSGSVGPGAVEIKTTTRVQGWEVNFLKPIVDAGEVTVSALAGYRYFLANEGLHATQVSLRVPAAGAPPNVLWGVYDQFDGRNNFHGGQIGLRLDGTTGRWLLNFQGKIAFGTNFQVVNIRGNSSATTAALPVPAVQPFPAGFLAVPTNSGRAMQSSYAVLPEGRLNLGYRIFSSTHFFVGYDFLYLSDAVRPGDQVDLVVDPSRSPILNAGAPLGPNRPRAMFNRSDFWVQGLVLGFDCRY